MLEAALHTAADWDFFVRLVARLANGTKAPLPVLGRTFIAKIGLPTLLVATVDVEITDAPSATLRVFVPALGRTPVKIDRKSSLICDFFEVTNGERRFIARANPSIVAGPGNV